MKHLRIKTILFCAIVLITLQTTMRGASPPSISELYSSINIADSPMRVCAGNNGYFSTDAVNNTMVAYDVFGRVINKKNGLKNPLGIAVGKNNTIYVAESGSKSVNIYDLDFNLIGYLGAGENEFLLPNHIAVSEINGVETVFVSDSLADEIKVYQQNRLVKRFGSRGSNPEQFMFPAGLAINNQNELLVVDQGNDRIQVFSIDGVYKRSFSLAKPGTFGVSGRAQGIACDHTGRIYVADMLQCVIKIFDENGNYLASSGKLGFGYGAFYNPSDIAVDKFNRAFVASPNSSKIVTLGVDCFLDTKVSFTSQYALAGSNVYFAVTTGCEFSSYQWMKDNVPVSDNERISGSTTKNLTLNSTTPEDSGIYYLVLSNQNTIFTSAPISLIVLSAPVIIKSPENQTALVGSDVVLEVFATGGNLSYQWFFNNLPFNGATSSKLVLTNVSTAAAGNYYVVVTNLLGAATSSVATLTIIDAPTLSFLKNQNGDLVFSWDSSKYILQSTTNLSGVWVDIPTNTSPFLVTVAQMRSTASMYFRLRKLP